MKTDANALFVEWPNFIGTVPVRGLVNSAVGINVLIRICLYISIDLESVYAARGARVSYI